MYGRIAAEFHGRKGTGSPGPQLSGVVARNPARQARRSLWTERGLSRCWWAGLHPLYLEYHDREWGRPVTDDRQLFEKLALEGFQAGLSWLTILVKRLRFRQVFRAFDPAAVADFRATDVRRLLADPGVVRHRAKIEAAVNNARKVLAVQEECGSFAAYVWGFEPSARSRPPHNETELRTHTPESMVLAADLRRRGFRYIGPVNAYAFMQAMGLVNDHLIGCYLRLQIDRKRARFRRPSPRSR